MRLLRVLMIWTGCERVPAPGEQRQSWTLDAVVPGFDTVLEEHGIEIPRTTCITLPLPVRTALLTGFALATENPATAIPATWARTSGSTGLTSATCSPTCRAGSGSGL